MGHYCMALMGLLLLHSVTSYSKDLYSQGKIPDIQGDVPYWWMHKGSPFKRSYPIPASSTGCNSGCQASTGSIDISSNPFLSANSLSNEIGGFAAVQQPQQVGSSLHDNPFLSGSSGGNKPPVGFISAGKPFSASSDYTSSTLVAGVPFHAPGYLPPKDEIKTIPCSAPNQACVALYLCRNGYVNNNEVNAVSTACNYDTEVCCNVRTPAPPPQPPVVPVTRPPQQTTPCFEKSHGCVSPDQCINGIVTNSNSFAPRAPPQKCYAPEVCCRFSDQIPSQNQISNVPHIQSVTPGHQLTSEGYVITVPDRQFPIQSSTQRDYYTPSASTPIPYGPPQPPQQPQRPQPTPAPYRPPSTPAPYKPPATPAPYKPPQTPAPYKPPQTPAPYKPPQTPAPYKPPSTPYRPPSTPAPYKPPVQPSSPNTYNPSPIVPSTYRPYSSPSASPSTIRPYVAPSQPSVIYVPTTRRPSFMGDQYIPPVDNHIGEPNNKNENYLPPPERGEEIKSETINQNVNVLRPNGGSDDAPIPLPPTQCPAATNCTQIEFCTAQGVISKTPVVLSSDQAAYRVPLSDCRNIEKGFTGKCCRDPDYVDPWPVSQLGVYNPELLKGLFDDGSYKPGKVPNGNGRRRPEGPNGGPGRRPNGGPIGGPIGSTGGGPIGGPVGGPIGSPITGPGRVPNNGRPTGGLIDSGIPITPNRNPNPIKGGPGVGIRPNPPIYSDQLSNPIIPNSATSQTQNTYTRTPFPNRPNTIPQRDKVTPFPNEPITSPTAVCATRDYGATLRGQGPIDAGFGEFPWQAMVLKESTKSILCGGAIIQPDTVVTSAHCVDGQRTSDIIVKGGEWKLGSTEEPKPFQNIRVKSISYHPAYQPTTLESDVAVLHLENELKLDKHIGPICIGEDELSASSSNVDCVATGWGKEIIRHHVNGSIMHVIDVSPLSENDCRNALGPNDFNGNTAICGQTQLNPCDIDEGSALACSKGDGKYFLRGIYSTESQCGSNQIVTFTKMDNDFIQGAIERPNSYPKPSVQRPVVRQPNGVSVSTPSRQYIAQPNTPQGPYVGVASTHAPKYLPPL